MRRVAVKRFSPLLPEVRCQLLSEGSPVPYSGASESPCTIILPCSSGSVSSVLVTNQQLHEGSNQIICSGSVSSPSILTTNTKRGFSDQASALNRSRGYGVVSKFKLREKKKKYNYITQERLIRPSTRSTEFGRATAFFRENNESTRLYARSRKQYEEVVNRSVLLPPDIAHRVFFDHFSNTRHWFKTTNMRSRPKRIKRIMGLPDDLYLKTIHGLIYRYSKQPQVKIAQQQLMKLYDLGQGFVDEGVSRNIGNDGHGLPCSPLIVNHHTDLQKHLLRDDGFNVMLSRFQQAVVAFDRQELYENNGGKVLVFNDAAYEPQSVKDGFSLVPLVQAVYANLTGSSDPLQGEDLEVLCAAFACAVAFRHHPSLPEYSSLLPKEHAAYNDLKAKRSKHSHDKLLANGYLYLFSDSYSIGKDFNELCEYLAVAPFIRGGKSLTECQHNEARSSIFLKNVLGCELLHEYQPQTTFFRQLAQEMTSQERKNIIKYVCHHRVRLTAAITAENRVLASLRVTFLTIYECRILMRDGKWMIVKALRERASGLAESSMHPVINIDSSKNRFLSPVLMPATPNALLNTIRMRNVRRRRALIRQGLTTPAQELSYDRHLLTTIHDMTVLQRASLTFPFCERIAMGEGRRTYRNPFSTFLAYRSRQMAEMFGRKIPCMSVIVLGIAKEWFALSQEEKNKFDARMIASKNTPQQFPLVNSSVSEDNQNFDADVFDDLLKDDAKKNEGVESLENVNADTVDNNNEKDDHLIPIPPMPEEGENLNQYSRKMAFFQNHRSAVLKKNSLSMAQSMAQQRSRKEKNKGIYHEEFESTLMSQLHIAKRFRVIAGAAIANEIKNPGGVQKNIMNSRKKKTRHDGCHLSVLSAEVEESLGTVLDKAVLDFKANATCRYGDRSTIVPLYLLASVALGRHHHPSPDCDAIHIEKDPKKIGGLTRKLNFSLNSISSYTKSSRATATIQYSRMVTAEKSLLSRAYGEALKVYEEKHSFFQDKDTLKIEAQNNVVPPYRPPSEYIIRVMTTSLNNMNKLQDVRESLRRHRLLDVLHRDSNITPINFHEVFTGTATLPPIPAVLRMRSRKVNTFMPRFCIPEILSEAAASRDSLVYVGPVQPALELPKSVISEAIPNLGVGSQGNTPPSKVVSATPQSSFPPINRYPLALEFNLSDEASDKRSALEPCIERSREIRLIGEMKQQKLDRQVENFAALQVPGGGGKTLSEVMLERGVDVIGLTREMQKKVMDRFYKERKEKVDIKRQFMYGVRPLTSSDDTFI